MRAENFHVFTRWNPETKSEHKSFTAMFLSELRKQQHKVFNAEILSVYVWKEMFLSENEAFNVFEFKETTKCELIILWWNEVVRNFRKCQK